MDLENKKTPNPGTEPVEAPKPEAQPAIPDEQLEYATGGLDQAPEEQRQYLTGDHNPVHPRFI